MIIGTLWPERYAAYTTVPAPGGADPHRRERQVLDLADVVRIAPAFSEAEQDRARAAAARDPRLRVALDAAGYGLTQTLAAAPQLVARWEDAQTASPYAWAVLTAALDMARLGARAPLSADLLRAAAPGYCTSRQLAEAPGNWFERARDYATGKLYGAVAALSPAGSRIGQVDGYTVADYLIQHASRERRYARVPASTWDAVLSHIRDPGDSARLADSASSRLLYGCAIPLYRHAADDGDRQAASGLAGLLEKRGDLDEAAQIPTRPGRRRRRVCRLVAGRAAGRARRRGRGRASAARPGRPGPGRPRAPGRSAVRARRPGRGCAVLRRPSAGKQSGWLSCWPGASTWTSCAPGPTPATCSPPGGWLICWPGAATWTSCAPGPTPATGRRADLLARRSDLDSAEQVLRARADAGDQNAALSLADLLEKRGDLDGAIQVLRARADAGDENAALWLAGLLEKRGDQDEAEQVLRTRADAGDELAAGQLARLLEKRGNLDELRTRADAGDPFAAGRLAELLARRGDLDELRARAEAGDPDAAGRLVDLLTEQGRAKEAERLRRFGLNPDGSIASA